MLKSVIQRHFTQVVRKRMLQLDFSYSLLLRNLKILLIRIPSAHCCSLAREKRRRLGIQIPEKYIHHQGEDSSHFPRNHLGFKLSASPLASSELGYKIRFLLIAEALRLLGWLESLSLFRHDRALLMNHCNLAKVMRECLSRDLVHFSRQVLL